MPIVLAIHGNTLYSANPPVVLPPLANLVPPSFAVTPLLPAQASAINGGTWNRAVDATRTWRIYTDQNLTTPYAQITGTSVSYTPEPDNSSFLIAQTGLSSLIGHNVYIDEIVSINGVAQPASAKSGAYLVQSAIPLSANAAASSQSFTLNQAIVAVQPVTQVGGTPPYTWAITPAPATGMSYNTATGYLTGTPTVSEGGVVHTVTVTDVVGHTASASYTEFVNSTIATLGSISAAQTFASMDGYLQALNSGQQLSGISESNGLTYTGTIQGPYGATSLRFGKIADPLNARTVLLCGANVNDPMTQNHIGRVEMGTNYTSMVKSGTTYWLAVELYIPTTRFAQGAGNLLQVHVSDPNADTPSGPFVLNFNPAGRIAANACVAIEYSYQAGTALSGGPYTDTFAWWSDNPQDTAPANSSQFGITYPRDQWVKWVFKYRGSIGSPGTGILQAWMDGTQVVNRTGIDIGRNNTAGYPYDYPKCGFDDFQNGGGSAGTYQLIRSWHLVQDSGYTEPQIRALMT